MQANELIDWFFEQKKKDNPGWIKKFISSVQTIRFKLQLVNLFEFSKLTPNSEYCGFTEAIICKSMFRFEVTVDNKITIDIVPIIKFMEKYSNATKEQKKEIKQLVFCFVRAMEESDRIKLYTIRVIDLFDYLKLTEKFKVNVMQTHDNVEKPGSTLIINLDDLAKNSYIICTDIMNEPEPNPGKEEKAEPLDKKNEKTELDNKEYILDLVKKYTKKHKSNEFLIPAIYKMYEEDYKSGKINKSIKYTTFSSNIYRNEDKIEKTDKLEGNSPIYRLK